MGSSDTEVKSLRLLALYTRLMEQKIIRKSEIAQEFHITERSVQRDMEVLRCFFADQCPQKEIVYDTKERGYRLTEAVTSLLNNSEILAVCKILLESRSLIKDEMFPIMDKLISCCVPEQNKKAVMALISNKNFII